LKIEAGSVRSHSDVPPSPRPIPVRQKPA
jgi:hypothetical protein